VELEFVDTREVIEDNLEGEDLSFVETQGNQRGLQQAGDRHAEWETRRVLENLFSTWPRGAKMLSCLAKLIHVAVRHFLEDILGEDAVEQADIQT